MKLKIKKLSPDAKLPQYAHFGDAGMDLFSIKDYEVKSGERVLVQTGLAMEFPTGYVALIWDKSGLANHSGLKVMGGVIDSSYRGEYKVGLLNTSEDVFKIKKGDKVAQLLIQPIETAEIEEVDELSESNRGENGFGSTGK